MPPRPLHRKMRRPRAIIAVVKPAFMDKTVADYNVQFSGFDNLMQFRIQKILLVSSPYDSAIIAEDDRLTEIIFSEYLDLRLRYAPKVVRADNGAEALELLRKEEFDLVLSMMRASTADTAAFALEVKRLRPDLPVVLLAYNLIDLEGLSPEYRAAADDIFFWTGDAKILLSIIKLIEDRRNIDADIRAAGVQALLLIEDSVRFYSSYLPLIYTELMSQTQHLIGEAVNLSHRLLRMRARPKILFARNWEEAEEYYKKYRDNLLGLITDIQFPRGGAIDPRAGIEFARMAKANQPDLPVLLQSRNTEHAETARQIGAGFLNKSSKNKLLELRQFIKDNFGFGDFVFCMPDGAAVGSVRDLHSMVQFLKTAPAASVMYHAGRNHFSKWLMARTEFELAHMLRPVTIAQFRDGEELRDYLIATMSRFLRSVHRGVIVDYSPEYFDPRTPVTKIGSGSLGGKSRGLAFLNSLLVKPDFGRQFGGARITLPPMAAVGTDFFDQFLEENGLNAFVRSNPDDRSLANRFLESELPEELGKALRVYIEKTDYPFAVRSSSVMEDSQSQPFAGIYKTYILPNSHPDPALRLEALARAVKLVYASTFSQQARTYMGAFSNIQDEEKMGVILQRLVGRRHGGNFYPGFSGVAQSYNFYPLPPIKSEEGAVHVALGLGAMVAGGRQVLRFSPAHPDRLYQFANLKAFFAGSQREFMALDMTRPEFMPDFDSEANLSVLGLAQAEADGTLAPVASTYMPDNDALYEGVSRKGPRLVTFAPILKSDVFPLAPLASFLLDVGRQAMGCHVEMEFAVDLQAREFNLLQIRPLSMMHSSAKVTFDDAARERIVCDCPKTLGHGVIRDLTDIIYVRPEKFNPARTPQIAADIGQLNERLLAEKRRYLLVGPGRWGSSDPWLGVPVNWGQISGVRVIIEAALPDFAVEPSYGSHFFHNVISLGIGYFILNSEHGEGSVDWKWFDSLPAEFENERVRHVRLSKPLEIRIDSGTSRGIVLRPD